MGEGPRDRRSVFGAAGSCPGSLHRQRSQVQGPGSAPLADTAPRAGGAAQPRLQATARPLSSRPSTSPRERSSANVSRAIGPESSANSIDLVEGASLLDRAIERSLQWDNVRRRLTSVKDRFRDWVIAETRRAGRRGSSYDPRGASWLHTGRRHAGVRARLRRTAISLFSTLPPPPRRSEPARKPLRRTCDDGPEPQIRRDRHPPMRSSPPLQRINCLRTIESPRKRGMKIIDPKLVWKSGH